MIKTWTSFSKSWLETKNLILAFELYYLFSWLNYLFNNLTYERKILSWSIVAQHGAVFREFGKVPERSEVFTTSKRSASKQLSTLLKKRCGKCIKIAGWRFKVQYYFFQNVTINFFKNRHSHFFLILRSNLCDICITRRCANLLSEIIDLLSKEGSKLVAFAVGEHFTGNLTWGVCQSLKRSKRSASVV